MCTYLLCVANSDLSVAVAAADDDDDVDSMVVGRAPPVSNRISFQYISLSVVFSFFNVKMF